MVDQLFLALDLPTAHEIKPQSFERNKHDSNLLLVEWWPFLILVDLVFVDKRSCLFTGFVFCAVLVCFVFFWERGGCQGTIEKLP